MKCDLTGFPCPRPPPLPAPYQAYQKAAEAGLVPYSIEFDLDKREGAARPQVEAAAGAEDVEDEVEEEEEEDD